MADGFVQVAPDSTGKSVDNAAIKVPAGTVITGSDGTTTTLSADATYYRQRVVIGDPERGSGVNVRGEVDRGTMLIDADVISELKSINETLDEIRLFITMIAER